MITVEHIPHLNNIKLDFDENKYPQPRDPNLPKLFFCLLAVAARGAGKTYLACQLLKAYEKYGIYDVDGTKCQQRIVLVSPTYKSNPCFTALKNLDESDVHDTYSDELLLSVLEDIKQEKENTAEYFRQLAIYKKCIKAKYVEDLSPQDYNDFEAMNFEKPKKPRYTTRVCNFLILDDLLGTNAFRQGKNECTNAIIKSRHIDTSVIIMSQNLKSIPKILRVNISVLCIFRFASKKVILDDLYEEVSNNLTTEQFSELFDFATKGNHNCLIIDGTHSGQTIFKRNLSDILKISSDIK